jgi:uncharacterized membrane protein YidH (DUF202 family)
MAKPTTGRVTPAPEPQPDPEQMATDTLMTSVFTGVSLIVATVVFGAFGSAGALLADRLGADDAWKYGLAFGLIVGTLVVVWGLRRFADRIRAHSNNLYRGAWIGSLLSLSIIVVMAYVPQLAIPQYCPPGAICQNGTR